MVEVPVYLLPLPGQLQTRVWTTAAVAKRMTEFMRKGDPDGAFLKKLQQAGIAGFGPYEGTVLRPEGNGVFRFGIRSSLFRLIGFYADGTTRRDFLAFEAILKRGQQLDETDRAAVARIASIRKTKAWRFEEDGHGPFPRAA